MFEERRTSSTISGQRLSSVLSDHSNSSESRRSSALSSGSQDSQQLQHQTPTTMQSKSSSEVKDLRRQALQRHQTFDSTTSDRTNAETEEHLLTAHSTRSHSCIAPVDISIRRLSGGMNLKEESSFDLAEADRLTPTGAQKVKSVEPDDHMVLLEPTSPSLLASGVTPMLGSMRQDTITSRTGVSIMSSTRSSFAVSRSEQKRREALWDLFQSECAFMYDHLMVLKNVFMEPLKKIQVEGFAMFAEPEVLFGNLDELCCVTYAFCKEFLSVILQQMNQYDINATEALVRLFQKSSKAASLTQAYHRYTLNYINALNYLETLRRQVEFNEFEKVIFLFLLPQPLCVHGLRDQICEPTHWNSLSDDISQSHDHVSLLLLLLLPH